MTKKAGLLGSGMSRVLPLLMIIMLRFSHGALGSSTSTGSNLGNVNNSNTGNNSTYSNNLVLNVYLNDAGEALVAGYADSITKRSFGSIFFYRSTYALVSWDGSWMTRKALPRRDHGFTGSKWMLSYHELGL
jgi:hypothetical protein